MDELSVDIKSYFHFIFKMEMMSDLKMTNKNEDQCKCYNQNVS